MKLDELNIPNYLTETQLSQWLQMKPSTLRSNRCKGTGIPYLKLNGSAIRYSKADVLTFIENSRKTTAVR